MKLKFEYGEYCYDYHLEFLDRKSLTLIVRPDLRIIVRAPKGCSLEKIEAFLIRKWSWLERQLAEFKRYQKPRRAERRYVSGESYYYLGRQYLLEVREAERDLVKLERNKIVIFTTMSVKNLKHNRKLFTNWLDVRTRSVFKRQFILAYKKFNYNKIPQLKIRIMAKRWGSCSRDGKVISLNPELIKTSTKAIYYVCLHELCHVNNPKHDQEFYDLLERKMSDWRDVKNSLEVNFG